MKEALFNISIIILIASIVILVREASGAYVVPDLVGFMIILLPITIFAAYKFSHKDAYLLIIMRVASKKFQRHKENLKKNLNE